jgi:galactoside O-acetyltransferase
VGDFGVRISRKVLYLVFGSGDCEARMLTSFYTTSELKDLGLAFVGNDVKLSRKASLYNPGKISIGEASRIDDFCVLAAGEGGIEIRRNVHVAVNVSLIGQSKITIREFAGISSRTAVYSSNDDYSGEYMTNPTVVILGGSREAISPNASAYRIVSSGELIG